MEKALRSWRVALVLIILVAAVCAYTFLVMPAPARGILGGLHSQLSTKVASSFHAPGPVDRASLFSSERAAQVVAWLSDEIGSRPAGSENELRAAQGLARRFTELGLETTVQSFPFLQYVDRGSSVRVAGGGGGGGEVGDIAAQALVNSASGAIRGRLVAAGRARLQDLAGLPLMGAVALIERGDITFAEKTANVAAAGAIGAVIYNNEPGAFVGLLPELSRIPAASIDDADGQRLQEIARTGLVPVELKVDAENVDGQSQNVIAVLPGSDQRTIVLGAHYDSVPQGPGANDNASGVGTVIELARVLASQPPSLTLKIVLFGAEEIGLVGSGNYLDSLDAAEKDRIVAMLNFDMLGVGDVPVAGGTLDLADLAVDIAAEEGLEIAPMAGQASSGSDHDSFIGAGVPALFFHRLDDPRYHTPDDLAMHVDPANLAQAGKLALEVIDRLEDR